MIRIPQRLAVSVLAGLLANAARGQAIDPDQSFAWGENIGFLNFAGAGDPAGSQEAFANDTYLEGFAWGEGVGWVNLGRGGGPYTNADGADFGVNRDAISGELSGYAWGENIGWINFTAGALADPPNPARIEDGRFRGYAWGENVGWINLDDDEVYVALLGCPADLAAPFGVLNFFDVAAFIALYNDASPGADLAAPFGVLNFFDVAAFIALYNAGCP